MVRFIAFLQSESCRTLVLALLHTLWQACVAAGLLCVYLRKCPASATGKRYGASVAALATIVLAGLVTWSILNYAPAGRAITLPSGHPQAPLEAATPTHSPVPFVVTPSGVSRGEGFQPLRPTAVSAVHGVQGRDALATGWQAWAMGAWLVGVVLMLTRTGVMLMGESRLRRQCRPLLDEQILSLVEQLRKRMRIGRRIAVYVSERISVPGVVGCVWPALLLPASAVSSIPVDDLRAILIHELAHIRRYDYLVNFCQTVIEALLFFNPAVWWISRQIRIEREACCDAAGVALAGPGVKYAEALVGWAAWWRGHLALEPGARPGRSCDARAGSPRHNATLSFAGEGDPGTLLDRIKRITIVGHRPQLRISWPSALAMVALSAFCLAGLWRGTNIAVTTAARILTPQERIDRIAEVSKEYGYSSRQGPEENVQISGAVRTWDSAPLSGRPLLLVCVRGRDSSNIGMDVSQDGTFYARIPPGRTYVTASAEGYSSAFAGPFEADPNGIIQGVELVLGAGFPGRIRLADEGGRPIPNAQLTGGYGYPDSGSYYYTIDLTTDANGMAVIDHAAARAIAVRIGADGFEAMEAKDLLLDPNAAKTIRLTKTQPATGLVSSKVTGLPIEGAQVHIVASATAQGSQAGSYGPMNRTPDTVTDAQGRFALTRLRHDLKYLIFIQSPEHAYRYVVDVEAGSHDIQVVLGEKKPIRGKIIGDLSLLATDSRSGNPIIGIVNEYRYPESRGYRDGNGNKSPVTIRDGAGYFEVVDFWGQTVTLVAGGEQVRLTPNEDSLEDIVIDLRSSKARRQVVLRFQVPPGGPPIEGQVRINSSTERSPNYWYGTGSQLLDIQDSQATCQVPVPSGLTYSIGSGQGKRPVGYWFNEPNSVLRIPAGDEPYVVTIPVYPAGAIYGTIFNADGSRAENARAALVVVQKPDAAAWLPLTLSGMFDGLSGVDRGTFNATPLPLGGRYAIVVYEDHAFAMSDAFSLDEKNPLVQTNIQLPRGVDVEGQLLDADGSPAQSSLCLDVTVKRGDCTWGLECAEIQPDENGRFVFKNVNPGPGGDCSVRVNSHANYRPTTQRIEDLQTPLVVRLEKGFRLTGTVVDDATGRPVPNAEVYALSAGQSSELLEAEGRTNDQGQFVFSNMAQREYQLNVRMANVGSSRRVIVTGGQNEPVALRIRAIEGSGFSPRKP